MTTYDDADTSCPMCSRGIDAADLCEDDDPMCARCHALYHLVAPTWRWSA